MTCYLWSTYKISVKKSLTNVMIKGQRQVGQGQEKNKRKLILKLALDTWPSLSSSQSQLPRVTIRVTTLRQHSSFLRKVQVKWSQFKY